MLARRSCRCCCRQRCGPPALTEHLRRARQLKKRYGRSGDCCCCCCCCWWCSLLSSEGDLPLPPHHFLPSAHSQHASTRMERLLYVYDYGRMALPQQAWSSRPLQTVRQAPQEQERQRGSNDLPRKGLEPYRPQAPRKAWPRPRPSTMHPRSPGSFRTVAKGLSLLDHHRPSTWAAPPPPAPTRPTSVRRARRCHRHWSSSHSPARTQRPRRTHRQGEPRKT